MISSSLNPADGFTKGYIKKLLGDISGGLNEFQTDIEPMVYLGSKCYHSNQIRMFSELHMLNLFKA